MSRGGWAGSKRRKPPTQASAKETELVEQSGPSGWRQHWSQCFLRAICCCWSYNASEGSKPWLESKNQPRPWGQGFFWKMMMINSLTLIQACQGWLCPLQPTQVSSEGKSSRVSSIETNVALGFALKCRQCKVIVLIRLEPSLNLFKTIGWPRQFLQELTRRVGIKKTSYRQSLLRN